MAKPANWKPREKNPQQSVPTSHSAEQILLNKEQVEQLLKLIPPRSGSNTLTSGSLIAHTGNFPFGFLSSSTLAPWIIDSGASDHMTSTSLFHCYTPSASNQKVKIADGSLSSIAGKGSIKISDHITLKSVLHVPNFSCNLLSVGKLSNDSNYSVVFYPNKCEFQDLGLGRTIHSAGVQDGLYYFEDNLSTNNSVLGLGCNVSSLPVRTRIMMWHFRLGHTSFSYLKHLFPSLFEKNFNKRSSL